MGSWWEIAIWLFVDRCYYDVKKLAGIAKCIHSRIFLFHYLYCFHPPMNLPSLSLGMLVACSSLVCIMPGSIQADTSGDFVYEDLGKSIRITGYTGSGGAIVTPEYISDKPVRAIGDQAFWNKVTTSSTLQLPDNLISIGDRAFAGCSGFTGNLEIPAHVTSMGDGAFENCQGFTGSLFIDGGLERIPDRAFQGCSGLDGSVSIRTGVKEIGEQAFYGCNRIRLIELSNGGLTTIGKQAFAFCTSVDSYLQIPKSVTSIGDEAFRGLRDLGLIQGEVTFWGNEPVMGSNVFAGAPGLHFVFRQGASGYSTPTWLGYPCRAIPNSLPVLDPIGQKTIMPGESIEIRLQATDSDDADLVYSASN